MLKQVSTRLGRGRPSRGMSCMKHGGAWSVSLEEVVEVVFLEANLQSAKGESQSLSRPVAARTQRWQRSVVLEKDVTWRQSRQARSSV